MKATIIDVETTGFGNSDRVTEIALLKFEIDEKGQFTVIQTYESLINPTIPIPQKVLDAVPITNEMVSKAPKFEEIVEEIIPILEFNDCFIAHNASFDKRMLTNELKRCGYSIDRPWECTQKKAKAIFPHLVSFSLDNLCKTFEIKNDNAHRAMSDVKSTFELFKKLI